MEALRDLIINISTRADMSGLNRMNNEMTESIRRANDMGRNINDMSRHVSSANNRMIDESQALNSVMNRQSTIVRQLARQSGMSATHLADSWGDMSTEMRRSMIQNHNSMIGFRRELMQSQFSMRQLGMQMGHYSGSTSDFIGEIHRMGKEHKRITDAMINSNTSMRQGFIQQIATMSAMSGQSEKIADNYDRMGNAIYRLNNPLLRVTANLGRMARNSNAASLAIQMLGPNASMKKLMDMTALITQGIMRQQAVLLVAGAAWLGFTAILANAAYGPDPSEVFQKQADALKEYRDAVRERTNEIAGTWGLFNKVQNEATKPRVLLLNLQGQVDTLRSWSRNMKILANRGVSGGLLAELQKAGPGAASQIEALTRMSDKGLARYAELWRQKHVLARTQAVGELEGLRKQTAEKIKALQDTLKPLGVEFEKFKSTWAEALQPFVDLWGSLASKLVKAGTMLGEFVQKLNEISPWITKIAGMFLYLFSTLLLILTPLAVGIGYIMGLKAAFAAAWTLLGPIIEGFAAFAGTAAFLALAIVGLGVAFYLLWQRSETFRNAVIGGWNAIKNKALEVWGFLSPYINEALGAIVNFGREKLQMLKSFWDTNGQEILAAAKNVFTGISTVIKGAFSVISAVFKLVWPVLLMLIKSVWGNIKGVINGALNVIMGLVKVFSGLFTGNFSSMWTGIKQVFFGAIQFIWNFINLTMFGKILGAGKLFVTGFKGVIVGLWQTIVAIFKSSVTNVKNAVQYGFTAMRLIGQTIMGGFKNAITGVWSAIHGGISGTLSRIGLAVKTAWTTMRREAKELFGMLKDDVVNTFKNIVKMAKELPGKIGNGIAGMAGGVTRGIEALTNKVFSGFKKMVNGISSGINWILAKLGSDIKIPMWNPGGASTSSSGGINGRSGGNKPVKMYANGTMGHPGGPAILGDGKQRELFMTPGGGMGLSPATDTLMNLPKGTMVFSGSQTRQLLGSGMFPAYKSGNISSGVMGAFKNTVEGTKKVTSNVWEGTKNIAGKVKDFGVDVFSYLSDPAGLFKKVMGHFLPSLPSLGGSVGHMLSGGFNLIKDKAVGFLKGKMDDFASMGSNVGNSASAAQARAWITQALQITGTPMSWLQPLLVKASHESTFNPRAINLWDSNAKAGHPSKGFLQTIDSTFSKYKMAGMNDIWNPIHNTVAAINYIKARYGDVWNTPGMRSMARGGAYKGYKRGGFIHRDQTALVGEEGPEFVNLKSGSTVTPHEQSMASFRKNGQGKSMDVHVTVNAPITVNGNMTQNDMEKTSQAFKEMIQQQMEAVFAQLNMKEV